MFRCCCVQSGWCSGMGSIAGRRCSIRRRSPVWRLAGGAGSSLPAIPTAVSDAWPATCAPWPGPVDCIALQATQDESGRRYPEFFRINFSRCIFCGLCEEACPTYAIQLTPDFEMSEYRRESLVYEKDDLLVSGQGKYPGYNFYRVAGVPIEGKPRGQAENESPPIDVHTLLP